VCRDPVKSRSELARIGVVNRGSDVADASVIVPRTAAERFKRGWFVRPNRLQVIVAGVPRVVGPRLQVLRPPGLPPTDTYLAEISMADGLSVQPNRSFGEGPLSVRQPPKSFEA